MKKLIISATVISLLSIFTSCEKEKTLSDFNPAEHSMDGDDSFFMLPMVITPNGDFLNEEYQLYNCSNSGHEDVINSFHLEVFKSGKKVYSTTNIDFRWNGDNVSGICEVKVKIGVNGKPSSAYHPCLYILRDDCIPEALQDFLLGDMIDARYGAIYHTQETFCQ